MGALCCKPEEIDFDGQVDLWHFYLLRSVGKGAFGKVRVVQHKQTKALYALKYINKQRIAKQRAVSNIIQERRLLEEIDSPFVCNLRYAFQDDENLFMVLDLMLGGDLRFHLDRLGCMKEEVVRFYVMEMALALEYLHGKGIVHRDLKPDNILLDERGHAHLTDFNIAVHFTERRALTSVAGSMAYMAPEVLSKRGYTYTVDWWSIGVVAFELLFGKRPFRGKTNSALTLAIVREEARFPEVLPRPVSPEALSVVEGFLKRDVNKRLGCRGSGGLETLKKQAWFRGLDWEAVALKEITPPFEPDSKKANFDATHELEELLLEDNPLKAKKRNPKLDLDSLTADFRIMEENFLVYDHTKMSRKSWFIDQQTTSKGSELATSTITTGSNSGGGGVVVGNLYRAGGGMKIPIEEQPLAELKTIHAPGEKGVGSREPSTDELYSGLSNGETHPRSGTGANTPSSFLAADAPNDPRPLPSPLTDLAPHHPSHDPPTPCRSSSRHSNHPYANPSAARSASSITGAAAAGGRSGPGGGGEPPPMPDMVDPLITMRRPTSAKGRVKDPPGPGQGRGNINWGSAL